LCAYRYVRPEDDEEHEGPYSPNTRDHAETARNFLLSALLDTSGREAHRLILALADDPMFAHFPDRLRLLARHRAASDAEGEPLDPRAIAALNERYEAPPNNRDGLFEVMVDRLDDLQQELSHGDCAPCRPATCRPSAPSSPASSARPPERKGAGPSSPAGSQRNGTVTGGRAPPPARSASFAARCGLG
jgi:hypothetical protein